MQSQFGSLKAIIQLCTMFTARSFPSTFARGSPATGRLEIVRHCTLTSTNGTPSKWIEHKSCFFNLYFSTMNICFHLSTISTTPHLQLPSAIGDGPSCYHGGLRLVGMIQKCQDFITFRYTLGIPKVLRFIVMQWCQIKNVKISNLKIHTTFSDVWVFATASRGGSH